MLINNKMSNENLKKKASQLSHLEIEKKKVYLESSVKQKSTSNERINSKVE
jgi:hypothetical protein